MTEFHHPYNFIPVKDKVNNKKTRKVHFSKIAKGEADSAARHDLWMKNTKSGRIVCRLHLDTPTVVGAAQEGSVPKQVLPYRREGRTAIPASSLRGVIGSIAEALSQSTLRVLQDRELKIRLRDNATGKFESLNAGTVYDYFRLIDRDLVPWQRPDRELLTPAELVFGVVDEKPKEDEETSFNLASRLRFADALLPPGKPDKLHATVTLKILSTPQAKYPAMYFHPEGARGEFISKEDFPALKNANGKYFRANGRKVYLHHRESEIQAKNWGTQHPNKNPGQKLRCTPLDAGQDFYFHIDFENLSEAELGLLLTSLRPSEEFRHRLGLGKPLGLGTVEVGIEGVFLIHRLARYGRDALNQPRYHAVWRKAPLQELAWTQLYPEEAARLKELQLTWPKSDMTLIDVETLGILETVGDPRNLEQSVQPPLLVGPDSSHRQDAEDETFRWFQENEKANTPQALKPIRAGQKLPVLNTYPYPPKRKKSSP